MSYKRHILRESMSTIGGEKRRALARLFACVSRTSVNESHFSEPMKVSFIERKILRCVKGLSGGLYVFCASRSDDSVFGRYSRKLSSIIIEPFELLSSRLLQLVGVERRTKERVKNF